MRLLEVYEAFFWTCFFEKLSLLVRNSWAFSILTGGSKWGVGFFRNFWTASWL
jgi:hypothetical protein